METFVREAIARAAFERGGEGRGDGFLEVCFCRGLFGGVGGEIRS